MARKYKDFKCKVKETDLNCRVYAPTLANQREANKVRNEAFHDALASNAPIRSQLHLILKKKGAWDEDREKTFKELNEKLDKAEKRLAEGGFKLKEARDLALEMTDWREERRQLLTDMSILDNNTAEGQADNMAFNYLVSVCLVYNKEESEKFVEDQEVQYFTDLEDYLNRSTDDIAFAGASRLAELMYDVGEGIDKKLPENRFMLDFDFVDDKLRLINKDKHLVDQEGHLINEDGRFVDGDGNFVDRDGNPIDKDGAYKVNNKGFLTDGGDTIFGKSHVVEDDESDGHKESDTDEE